MQLICLGFCAIAVGMVSAYKQIEKLKLTLDNHQQAGAIETFADINHLQAANDPTLDYYQQKVIEQFRGK